MTPTNTAPSDLPNTTGPIIKAQGKSTPIPVIITTLQAMSKKILTPSPKGNSNPKNPNFLTKTQSRYTQNHPPSAGDRLRDIISPKNQVTNDGSHVQSMRENMDKDYYGELWTGNTGL
jgi:hypothetical protein